jgi:hypothetical protein
MITSYDRIRLGHVGLCLQTILFVRLLVSCDTLEGIDRVVAFRGTFRGLGRRGPQGGPVVCGRAKPWSSLGRGPSGVTAVLGVPRWHSHRPDHTVISYRLPTMEWSRLTVVGARDFADRFVGWLSMAHL